MLYSMALRDTFWKAALKSRATRTRELSASARYWMVLIIVFAPSGLPTPYCKGNARLATDSFFAAITDLSASLRNDIMRSGLWPPVRLASGVICLAFRYCSTELGTADAAMCAITCTNKPLFPAREPKSYQCSARMPSGPCSLGRGILRRVVGMCSVTSDKNRAHTGACTGAGGSGSAQKSLDLLNNLLRDWNWWCISGSG